MEKTEFLPLGSVVMLTGVIKRIVIVQRAIELNQEDGGTKYYDYGAILYPEGLVEDQLVYFNQEDISRLIFKGFSDDDDTIMVEQLNEALAVLADAGKGSLDGQVPEKNGQAATTPKPNNDDDPFAAVREDDE
ncbi:DUF4176 domain-containing protein [Schleiferilactobacillus perolens]|nr:DUF4176 domain-containing protein [Schleiferilactobacillus perolens]